MENDLRKTISPNKINDMKNHLKLPSHPILNQPVPNSNVSILEPIPNINIQILDPIPNTHINIPILGAADASQLEPSITDRAWGVFEHRVQSPFNKIQKLPSKPKITERAWSGLKRQVCSDSNKIQSLFKLNEELEVKESELALRKFMNQYTVHRQIFHDLQSFMGNAKQSITNVLENNQETKEKLILDSVMEKVGIKSGEQITT